MNPDTRRLELMEADAMSAAKELVAPQRKVSALSASASADDLSARKPPRTGGPVIARQVAEPHKSRWTTYQVGEMVEAVFRQGGAKATKRLRVKNLHADGLLLSGKDLSFSFFVGMELAVKGERCRVKHISSKGMYVVGA